MAGDPHTVAGWIGNLLGMCNFIVKAVAGVTCMIWLRWTLPRLRIDQVMTTCLKYCVPMASAMLAGAMLWSLPACPAALHGGTLRLVFGDRRRSVKCEQLRRSKSPIWSRFRRNTDFAQGGMPIMDAINWHSCFFLLFAIDRLRFGRGGGGDRQHRAHGVLAGRVAGAPWPGCSSWPGPTSSAPCN